MVQVSPSRPGRHALQIAQGLIGWKEEGGENLGPIVVWSIQHITKRPPPLAWCCGFVLTCLHYAGVTPNSLGHTLECAVLWRSLGGKGFVWHGTETGSPQPDAGDLVFFSDTRGHINHIGFVERFDIGAHALRTVEGNARDAVRRKQRPISSPEVFGYARVPDFLQGEMPTLAPPRHQENPRQIK